MTFIVGAAVGYVLGTRAGRERYEQLVRASRQVTENPTVQEKAEVLRTKGGELAGTAMGRAEGMIRDHVPERLHRSHEEASVPEDLRDPRRETSV
ncbi:YtxH domain-containing protein [Spirillospora sp. CA-294931]|uniref:YtxH domain-containing protein n=1 Tax=Spirillospora sp. CA-294931 TaxID=3240042 RepID=UPI003D8F8D98